MLNLIFMKETYLHYLWRQKRLPFHHMTLKDGRPFRVISPGFYNAYNSGPDFSEARIEIDGIVWVGPVEIHLRSSDWKSHNHHLDSSYDHVILHVVLKDDKPVHQNGIELPVLEIGEFIDTEHYRQFLRFLEKMENAIPCESFLPVVDPVFMQEMIARCAVERLERKYRELMDIAIPDDPIETFYRLIARAFGTKHNAMAFEQVAFHLPYRSMRQLEPRERKISYFELSGLNENGRKRQKHDKSEGSYFSDLPNSQQLQPSIWIYGGVRPSAHPHIRIQQFCSLIDRIDLDVFLSDMPTQELLNSYDELIRTINKNEPTKRLHISNTLKHQLLINAVSLFLFWWGKVNLNPILQENALELLSKLPPEDNRLVRDWKKRNVRVESALESQALIELLQQYCMRKKCLSCSVGNKVLNR
jgi:hypothetical protein